MAIKEPVDERASVDSWDRVFRALAAEPRRQIVMSLAESSPERELSLPEAANPSSMLQDPDELMVELLHEHLPIPEGGDYVESFRTPLGVRGGPAFDEVAVVLESLLTCVDDVPDQLVVGCQRLEAARGMLAE
jgi:hypothetical protein